MTAPSRQLYVTEQLCIGLLEDAIYLIDRARSDLKPTDRNLRSALAKLRDVRGKLQRRTGVVE